MDENNMPRIEGEITHDKAEIKEHFKKENGPEWVKLERNLEEEITQVLRAVKVSLSLLRTQQFKMFSLPLHTLHS